MKSTLLSLLTCFSLAAGLASAAYTGTDNGRSLQRRKSTALIHPVGLPALPSGSAAAASAAAAGLNLTDIQGDVLIGMMKNKELFFFFTINDAATFKSTLQSDILPLITSTTQILNSPPITAVNIAFAQTGLTALNITDSLGDTPFATGQQSAANSLGDPSTTNWQPEFTTGQIHGVILLASGSFDDINDTLDSIKSALGDSIAEVYSLEGAARPGSEAGHEHFGFLDGISNPAVSGFQTPKAGQAVVNPGEILVGETGDTFGTRPSWAKDGSFLVFRQLKQLVPEFNKFLADNPLPVSGLSPEQGSDLLGARMVGRWKSGAPVFLSPLVDNPTLGADPSQNNNFTYAEGGNTVSNSTDQSKCPFSAHIRKTRPRADLGLPESSSNKHHIVRAGIPFGDELTDDEIASNTTQINRGLAFVAYQSSISNGFSFLQQAWVDNTGFVHANTGFDPIIGANGGNPRTVGGLDPTNPSAQMTLVTDFVVSQGGEYFFSPSISAIATHISV
ncbi:fungal peroxidase [Mycena amicta]|nr:fungal peroxidase [Mycena amicta]